MSGILHTHRARNCAQGTRRSGAGCRESAFVQAIRAVLLSVEKYRRAGCQRRFLGARCARDGAAQAHTPPWLL